MAYTAEEIAGRVWGSFFFVGFGTLWLLSFASSRLPTGLRLGVLVVAAVLLGAGVLILRRSRRLPLVAEDPVARKRRWRIFNLVNGVQWTAIVLALVLLNVFKLPAYIAPAITLIVGLHLFPLAAVFGYTPHHVTGALLVVWGSGGALLLPRSEVARTVAMGTGLILFGSAALMLWLSFRQLQRASLMMQGDAAGFSA